MKSNQLYAKARASLMMAALFFTFSAALLIWAIVASLHHSILTLPAWGLFTVSAAIMATYAAETSLHFRMAQREEEAEWRRAIRPRL